MSTLTGDYLVNRYLEDSGQPVAYVEGDQSLTMNNRILDAGGVVLNLNPEGLGCADDPKEVLENFAKVGSAVTRICAWGERQRDIITSFLPEEQRRLVDVTGYHSFDLASPEFVPYYRDEALIRQYGDGLILMNTSFATSNHKMGFENYVRMLRRMAEWKVYDNQEFLSFLRNQHAYQTRVIDAFVELARALSVRFPERSVIIRPHPAEDRETYASRLRDLGNVTVTNEGTVRQWLACAGAVVHHDCTTGLEAFLMGRNVIQYRPFFDERYTAALLSGVGSMAETPDEVFARIRKGSMDEASVQAQRDRLSPYMATIEQGACARLADMVAGYGGQLGHWEPEPLNWIGRAKAWRKYASKLLRARQPGRNGRKVRYALEKFPRIPVEEIRRRVSGLRGVKPSLPEAEVVELALNTFLIRPAG